MPGRIKQYHSRNFIARNRSNSEIGNSYGCIKETYATGEADSPAAFLSIDRHYDFAGTWLNFESLHWHKVVGANFCKRP